MPAETEVIESTRAIDWAGIRANAVTMGIRAAARAASSNLPTDEQTRFVNRVLQRAHREEWTEAKQAAMSAVVVRNEKPMSSNVISGSDAAAQQLADDSRATRAALATAARKAGEAFARKDGEEVIELAKPFQQITSAAGMIGGWGDKGQDQGADMLILSIGGNVSLGGQHVHAEKPAQNDD